MARQEEFYMARFCWVPDSLFCCCVFQSTNTHTHGRCLFRIDNSSPPCVWTFGSMFAPATAAAASIQKATAVKGCVCFSSPCFNFHLAFVASKSLRIFQATQHSTGNNPHIRSGWRKETDDAPGLPTQSTQLVNLCSFRFLIQDFYDSTARSFRWRPLRKRQAKINTHT